MRPRLLLLVVLGAAASCTPPPAGPGTLLLGNPNFPPTDVEAVITASPDCGSRGAGYVSTQEFVLPSYATRFVDVPPGVDVCWRRDRDPGHPVAGAWSNWNRAFVVPGTTMAADL